jgi:hypothetical protein
MKTLGQINQKLKQVRYRRVKKELSKLTKRAGRNCVNQKIVKTPSGPLGVCKLDCAACDSLVRDRAVGCEDFQLNHTSEQLKESLRNFFETREPNEISVRFPEVAALLWVLGEDVDEAPLMDGAPALTLGAIDVWTDTAEKAEGLNEWFMEQAYESVVVEQLSSLVGEPVEGLVAKVEEVKEALATETASRQRLHDENVALTRKVDALEVVERKPFWKRMFG